MADDNKQLKYIRYAIGEIVLVVIGILIALQVNNWNEDRKESLAIKNVLFEIKEDLIQDKAELERNIELRTEDFEAQKRIINVLETNRNFNENVFLFYYWTVWEGYYKGGDIEKLTSHETISRCKRKLVEKNPQYKADQKIRISKQLKEESFREWSKS